jgi:2-polyprenyl-6-hydroxyphenyl methylase/3-demethylubiquinone-9 3-methyltransferase
VEADARVLPYGDASFEAVCAMDFLEHVAPIDGVIAEVARVLAPGGLFFFHTFNRNLFAWLVVIKGVEWFVRNVPRDMHVLEAFVKPEELRAACASRGLAVRELLGCVPTLSRAFARMIATGVVPGDFAFHFSRSTRTGYSGVAVRDGERVAPGRPESAQAGGARRIPA